MSMHPFHFVFITRGFFMISFFIAYVQSEKTIGYVVGGRRGVVVML